MLEFIGAVALTWWFVVGMFFWVILAVHSESDVWSFVGIAILGAVTYFFFGLDPATVGYGLLAYIPTGIGWSIFRWKRHCKRAFSSYSPDTKDNDPWTGALSSKQDLIRLLDPKRQMNKIITWIFVWPFSFLDNLIGDIIDLVRDFVKKYLIQIYNNIAGNYLDQIK